MNDAAARRFLHGQDAMFLQPWQRKKGCNKPHPQTVTNFMHGLFGLLNVAAGGGLMGLGINALVQGKSSISLAVVSLTPPAAIAMGVVLLTMGLCLLGLLLRDKYNLYQRRKMVQGR